MKKVLKFALALLAVLLVAGGVFACLALSSCVSVPEGSKAERLYIYPHAGLDEVLDSLSHKSSVSGGFALRTVFSLVSSRYGGFRAGSYELSDGISPLRLALNAARGYQTPVRLSFNNVRTREQLCARLSAPLMLDSADVARTLASDSLQNACGLDSANILCLFLPDTYEFYWTVTPVELFDKFRNAYDDFWTPVRSQKAKEAGLTPAQVVTLASIVEEESNLRDEQPRIAGLYLNRFRKGMKLQADPTVKFATGDFSLRRILLEHINATRSNPYNTYTHVGLPPGPIRIPAKATVDAVLNYERHDFLFMCAKGAGQPGHNFTVTYGEHQKNAASYQQGLDKRGIRR
ncbi:MAG: endolytic transglycosylase MltG [Paludibacteraceae bacterium]|nr:endolytic transglycosylase MltG [Paludibacteraceae bacterium]